MGRPKQAIIVLGLTYNQIPLIAKAREMGYRAIAIGVGGGQPVAAEHADAWFLIDTSAGDDVLALAKRENAAGLVTCGTSTAMCTAAYVTEALGLSDKVISYEVSRNAVFKDRFRKLLADMIPRGLASADASEAFSLARDFCYPLILKPGDGGGGKGITVVRTPEPDAFAQAFAYAVEHSRSRVVVVEEFIEGAVLGVESLVLDGRVHVLAIADKDVTAPPRCITLGVSFPSMLPEPIQQNIRQTNAAAISQLGITWGATHIDLAVTAEGRAKIIDIGPRLAGGPLMSHLVPDACDFDVYRAVIDLAVGRMPQSPGQGNRKHYASRFLVAPGPGTLQSVTFPAAAAAECGVENIRQLVPNGTVLDDPANDGARLLLFTTKADSHELARKNLDAFTQAIEVNLE